MKTTRYIPSLIALYLVSLTCMISCGDPKSEDPTEAGEMSSGTEGGIGPIAGEMSGGEMTAGETTAGEMMAGEMSAGEMTAGEMTAGEMTAGEMTAGEMTAGEMTAGEMPPVR